MKDCSGGIGVEIAAARLSGGNHPITRLAAQQKTYGSRAGLSPHAFMLRLLEEQVQASERSEEFLVAARQADERMQERGTGYAAADVHGYLEAKGAGRKATRPKPVRSRK